jgi:hypothetical protein
MKHLSIICAVMVVLFIGDAASAQVVIPPGGSQFNPPLPPPPPPPKIEVPVVPQMDAPMSPTYQPPPRRSFSDRMRSCLDEAAAGGLGPGEREAYARSCANSR